MNAVDFFCGAGGLTRGLRTAGIDVRLGIDIDRRCEETYQANNPGSEFLAKDVTRLQPSEIRHYLARKRDDLLLAACAPCQPFAQLNRGTGRDGRAILLRHILRFVDGLRPRYVLVENVPGFQRVDGFSTYRRFASALHRLGYSIATGVLDAKNYGVPQTRRRLVMLAARGTTISIPKATHGAGLKGYATVRSAISRYAPLSAGEMHSSIPNHRAAALSEINLRRLASTPADGGSRTDWPRSLWLACHSADGYKGHTDAYGRMRWDSPAPTLTCRCHSLSNGRYGHPEQLRAISLREAARLQGFTDDYLFVGPTLAHLAAQIGNAVPVPLAAALGHHLLKGANG